MSIGTGETAARFWRAWADGEILLQRCGACAQLRGYPRPICASCGSASWDFLRASGRGEVHSYTKVHRRGREPTTVVLVELEEGIRLLGVWDEPQVPIRIGLPAALRSTGRPAGPLTFVAVDGA